MLKSFHTFSAPHTNALSASIVLAISIGILFTHSGCSANPGGGATVLKSPDIVESGEPIELALHFTATGQRKGSLAKRFTKVMCHYEVDGTVTSESIAGTIVNVSENLMEMKFLIPTTRAAPG